MKVIILCGGLGTRLKEETEFKPKPMVYIGNKPLLWHIMKIYAHYGFKDFILALGYKADYIKDYFLNQKAFTADFSIKTKNHKIKYFLNKESASDNFNIIFVDTGLSALQGERILKCKKYIPQQDKYFMVTYGDAVINMDIQKLLKFHKSQKTIGTITGIHPRSKYGLISIGKNNLITNFEEKPILPVMANGGFMVFNKKAFNYFRKGETDHAAIVRLIRENQLSAYQHKGFWYAIDTYREYEDLNEIWNKGNAPWKIWH